MTKASSISQENYEKAKEIANHARSKISDYCINTCKAKCCNVGKLLLQTNEEVETICGEENISKYAEEGIIEKTQNNFVTYALEKQPCRHLKDNVFCTIHKEDRKPTICDDYPLFLTKTYVIASPQCPAVTHGEMDEEIEKIKQLGFNKF